MKWKPAQLQVELSKASPNLPYLVCVYGDDAGVVRQFGKATVEKMLADPNDPFLSDRISVEDLQQEPGKLLDSASTMSFGGGTRVIRVEGVNGDLTANQMKPVVEAVKYCLEQPLQDVIIIIPAPRVDAKNALAKEIEKHKVAVAIRCFQDTARDLNTFIREYFQKEGKRISGDALSFLLENLGNDREITQRELEVLNLYAGKEDEITLEHCLETVSSAPSLNIFKLCDAIGNRDKKAVDIHLQHMVEEGEDLFRASTLILRHLRRLLKARELMDSGMSSDAALKSLAPPVFFGKPEFLRQAQTYPKVRLEQAYDRFYKLQRDSRQGLVSANHAYERGILGLGL